MKRPNIPECEAIAVEACRKANAEREKLGPSIVGVRYSPADVRIIIEEFLRLRGDAGKQNLFVHYICHYHDGSSHGSTIFEDMEPPNDEESLYELSAEIATWKAGGDPTGRVSVDVLNYFPV